MRVHRGIPFQASQPTALTIGNFDGLHLGHQAMLDQLRGVAQAKGLRTAVLTFEPHPRELFTPENAPTRLTSLREKMELLRDAGVDDLFLCHFNRQVAGLDHTQFTRDILSQQLQARYILIGDDFRFGKQRQGSIESLSQSAESLGFEVQSLNSVLAAERRVSSTAVRESLAAGNMALAEQLLGRPYSISGRVMHGDKIGRELGFPTANVQLKHNRPPLMGIFVVRLHGLAQVQLGVASLGIRPTINDLKKATLEVHLFDFQQDIYRQHVRVEFLHKLRDEEKYTGLEPLKAAIAKDCHDARAWLAANHLTTR